MIVEARYHLPAATYMDLHSRTPKWGFGLLSEAVFYRTYSRDRGDGTHESWADTVIRCVEGVMSIWKDHHRRVLGQEVDQHLLDEVAVEMADAIFEFRFLPPGRSLFTMGTEYVYQRGSHSLNNCAFVSVKGDLSHAADWLMDALMCGVGVGFDTHRGAIQLRKPAEDAPRHVITIPDSREGWAASVARLIQSYQGPDYSPVTFDYSEIRPLGAPIRGFGGTASGPTPLIELHERIRGYLDDFCDGKTTQTRLIADIMNAIGACVVAGNVRRSAEIALGSINDDIFLNLKNYELNPERGKIGWMSNNSVVLSDPADFEQIPRIAAGIAANGEPGMINLLNIQKYGRYGELKPDFAIGINPCGEIPLESHELCNLVEVFPTRNRDTAQIFRSLQLATIYASIVSLLPSHREETNAVVERNRRIGVSLSGIADWIDATSHSAVYGTCNQGYKVVEQANQEMARFNKVNPAVRLTTVKPSGTISLLAGVSPGMHHPEAGVVLRRMRVAQDHWIIDPLVRAGVPCEPDVNDPNTAVLSFPTRVATGKTRSVRDVPISEQAGIVAALSKFWADNAVSNTLKFQPEEEDLIDGVLSTYAPYVKSMSMMRDDPTLYPQMPIEAISDEEYNERVARLGTIDWSQHSGGSSGDSYFVNAFCDGDVCALPGA